MKTEHGSATLVVLTLLALMIMAVMINGRVLRQLSIELGRIERHQEKHFKSP